MLSRQGTVRHTPVQYDVRTAWYNYTRRDGTTYAGMLLSRNGTKTGRFMILAYDVMQSVRCSGACRRIRFKVYTVYVVLFYVIYILCYQQS